MTSVDRPRRSPRHQRRRCSDDAGRRVDAGTGAGRHARCSRVLGRLAGISRSDRRAHRSLDTEMMPFAFVVGQPLVCSLLQPAV